MYNLEMPRYTLRTFCDNKILEVFEHRTPGKLVGILSGDRFHHANETSPFGEPPQYPNKFTIIDSQRSKLFEGTVEETVDFLKNL